MEWIVDYLSLMFGVINRILGWYFCVIFNFRIIWMKVLRVDVVYIEYELGIMEKVDGYF